VVPQTTKPNSPVASVKGNDLSHKSFQGPGVRQNSTAVAIPKYEARPPASRRRTSNFKKANLTSVRSAEKKAYNGDNRLPRGKSVQGLKALTRRERKLDTSEVIQERLKKKSPWFQSIVDPLHGADVKIPDETGVDTGTMQVVERFERTVNASGVTGFKVLTPYINSVNTGTKTGANYQFVDGTASATTIAWTGIAAESAIATTAQSSLQTMTIGVRPVSAAVYAESLSSFAENKGEFVAFTNPYALNSGSASPYMSDYINMFGTSLLPINTNEAIRASWLPMEMSGRSYHDFVDPDLNALGLLNDECPGWQYGILVNGATAGSVMRFTVVTNYEFVPKTNALNILDAQPSPTDEMEESLVGDWIQETPACEVIQPSVIAKTPSPVAVNHGDDDVTGFGMFANVLTEVLPYAAEALFALI
jgi:hypothetical protein